MNLGTSVSVISTSAFASIIHSSTPTLTSTATPPISSNSTAVDMTTTNSVVATDLTTTDSVVIANLTTIDPVSTLIPVSPTDLLSTSGASSNVSAGIVDIVTSGIFNATSSPATEATSILNDLPTNFTQDSLMAPTVASDTTDASSDLASPPSLINGIGNDLLFSVIGLGAAVVLLTTLLFTCFCHLKLRITKLSNELRLMKDDDRTTISDGLRLRLMNTSNGKPGHSTISSFLGEKHALNGSVVNVDRAGEGGGSGGGGGENGGGGGERGRGAEVERMNHGARQTYHGDNHVTNVAMTNGRYVYSQDVRDSPNPMRRSHFEREEDYGRYTSTPAEKKDRYRPEDGGRPASGIIYERPAIYQKTPLIQALRPDDDAVTAVQSAPERDVNGGKAPDNIVEAKHRSAAAYRSPNDIRYDGRPASIQDRDPRYSPSNVGWSNKDARSTPNEAIRMSAPESIEPGRHTKGGKGDRRDFEATVGEDIDSWRKLYRREEPHDELLPTKPHSRNDVPSRKSEAQNGGYAYPESRDVYIEGCRENRYDHRPINSGGLQYYPYGSMEFGNRNEERF